MTPHELTFFALGVIIGALLLGFFQHRFDAATPAPVAPVHYSARVWA